MNYLIGDNHKDYPHSDESILYYLVVTEHKNFESAIRLLRSAVRDWQKSSKLALTASSGTLLLSLLGAMTGIGAWVVLPLFSAIFSGLQAWGSRKELQVRERELELLKSCPTLLDLMYQAYSKGVDPMKLVYSYNAIVGAYEVDSATCGGVDPIQAFGGQMSGALAGLTDVYTTFDQMGQSLLTPPSGLHPHIKPAPPQSQPQAHTQSVSSSFSTNTPQLPVTGNSALPPFDRDRILNESKGLMIIGDMGAAKTCTMQHIAGAFTDHGIIVFDPHGKTNWGNAYVISKMGAIYEQLRILLELLENGDESPLLVIADEWLEIRGDRRNKSGEYKGVADDFIRLFSTKPRKFNKLACFILHSPNVEAAGVDSFLRVNYLMIHLGKVAGKEFPSIQPAAYPCVVDGEQFVHPTHGHHTEFKPNGNAPRNIEPLASRPIKIPLAYVDGAEVKVCPGGWVDGHLNTESAGVRERLEMLWDVGSETVQDGSETVQPTQNFEPLNRPSEPLNQPSDKGFGDFGDGSQFTVQDGSEQFTPLKLTLNQVRELVQSLNQSLNQTQIIEQLWQVKKGGSDAWKQAHSEYKQVMGEQ